MYFQRFNAADQCGAQFLHGGLHGAEGSGCAHRVQGLEGGGELSDGSLRPLELTKATDGSLRPPELTELLLQD